MDSVNPQNKILYLWTEIIAHLLCSLFTHSLFPKTCKEFKKKKKLNNCGTRMGVVPHLVSKIHCEILNLVINSWCFCLFLCFWIPEDHTMGGDMIFLAHISPFRCTCLTFIVISDIEPTFSSPLSTGCYLNFRGCLYV